MHGQWYHIPVVAVKQAVTEVHLGVAVCAVVQLVTPRRTLHICSKRMGCFRCMDGSDDELRLIDHVAGAFVLGELLTQ